MVNIRNDRSLVNLAVITVNINFSGLVITFRRMPRWNKFTLTQGSYLTCRINREFPLVLINIKRETSWKEKGNRKQEENAKEREILSDLDRSGHCKLLPPPTLPCSWPRRGKGRYMCATSTVSRPHTSRCTRSTRSTPATLRPLKKNTGKLHRAPRYTLRRHPRRTPHTHTHTHTHIIPSQATV